MANRNRISGDEKEFTDPGALELADVLNLRRNRRDFDDEVSLVETAPYPFYESRNVQGE